MNDWNFVNESLPTMNDSDVYHNVLWFVVTEGGEITAITRNWDNPPLTAIAWKKTTEAL